MKPKTPKAPMGGRWLRKGEQVQAGDYFRFSRGYVEPVQECDIGYVERRGFPDIRPDGGYYGYFRPGKERSRKTGKPRKSPAKSPRKKKGKTRSWWVFETWTPLCGEQLIYYTSYKAAKVGRLGRSLGHGEQVGPIVRVEVPRA